MHSTLLKILSKQGDRCTAIVIVEIYLRTLHPYGETHLSILD